MIAFGVWLIATGLFLGFIVFIGRGFAEMPEDPRVAELSAQRREEIVGYKSSLLRNASRLRTLAFTSVGLGILFVAVDLIV